MRGISLSVEVRLGKVEETRRAEGDDFTLRVFVGKRSATVSANVFTDPAELAERAVAMARVAPEDVSPASPTRPPRRRPFPTSTFSTTTIPSAAELTEDGARGRGRRPRRAGRHQFRRRQRRLVARRPGARHLHGFTGSYLGSRFGLSASAIAGTGTGMERDYDSESKVHRTDLADPPRSAARPASARCAASTRARSRPAAPTVVYDPRISRGLVGSLAGADQRRRDRPQDQLPARQARRADLRPRRSASPTTRTGRAGSASRPFDGEGVAGAPLDLVTDGVLQTWFLDSATARELGLATNGRAARAAAAIRRPARPT